MKFVKYTVLAVILLVVAALVAGWLYLEPLVKGVVHKYGTQIVGTEVNLGGFSLNPLKGEVSISGLTVANPKGYSAPNLLSLGGVSVKVNPKSLLSDTIVVENVAISKPEITYEMPDFTTSNVMQIQQNVAKNTASSAKAEPSEEKAEVKAENTGASKKVIIRKVLVEDGALSAITPLQKNDNALTLNMPAIEITGIGEEKQAMSISESVTEIFNKILFNATSVVTKALGNAKDMAKNAANAALEDAKNAGEEAAGGLLDSVKFW